MTFQGPMCTSKDTHLNRRAIWRCKKGRQDRRIVTANRSLDTRGTGGVNHIVVVGWRSSMVMQLGPKQPLPSIAVFLEVQSDRIYMLVLVHLWLGESA